MKSKRPTSPIVLMAFFIGSSMAAPLGTTISYSGRLQEAGSPANGNYDLVFGLFDTNATGASIAGPLTNSAVTVNNGQFNVLLDFGPAAFNGGARWLEIGVRTNSATAFVTLDPRQRITAIPYALYAGGGPDTFSHILLQDDFISATAVGSLGWTLSSANGGSQSIDSESNHPGIARLSTGIASASGYSNLYLGANSLHLGSGTLTLEFLIRIPTLSTSTERFTARIGLGDSLNGSHSKGVWLEYDEETSTNWRICSNDETTATKTTSSVLVAENTWMKTKIVVNASASVVEYFIDDVSMGTVTATIPTISGPRLHIVRSVGTAARTLEVDAFKMDYVLTTAR